MAARSRLHRRLRAAAGPLTGVLLLASCSQARQGTRGRETPAEATSQTAALAGGQTQNLNAFLRTLPNVQTPPFTQTEAMALVAMPLACLDHPQASPASTPFSSVGYLWPYNGEPHLLANYAKNRAFYGCYDWHSAVNSTWTMVEVLKRFPKIPIGPLLREKLDEHLGKSNLQGELAFFEKARMFEMPFGRAWLLRLYGALVTWNDRGGRRWAGNVAPLAKLFSASMVKYLDELPDPTRLGEHPNTAYSMNMMLDYADAANDVALRQAIFKAAKRFFLDDRDCPTAYEPSGAAFLSPCLEEAKVMSRVIPPAQFDGWFSAFMPPVYSPQFAPLAHPFDTSGITDPKQLAGKSHLIGLGLFRGEAMLRIAQALPPGDPRVAVYRRLASINAEKSFQGFEGAGYLGSHWMGTYAVLYELAATSARRPDSPAAARR